MRSGGTPNLLITPAMSKRSLVIVLINETEEFTNWAKSLSPVEIIVSHPAALAWVAKVPITSSASTPDTIKIGQPMACTIA